MTVKDLFDNYYDHIIKVNSLRERAREIPKVIGEPASLEQLAEECTELAKAALKKARKLRGENPTPRKIEGIDLELAEEVTDVFTCIQALNLGVDYDLMEQKINRWRKRIVNNQTAVTANINIAGGKCKHCMGCSESNV